MQVLGHRFRFLANELVVTSTSYTLQLANVYYWRFKIYLFFVCIIVLGILCNYILSLALVHTACVMFSKLPYRPAGIRTKTSYAVIYILGDVSAVLSLQSALKFNGGGHINHSIFWTNLSPNGGGEPTGDLAGIYFLCYIIKSLL